MPLKGIPKVLTPDILHALSSMGHGDDIVLADAHFPASSIAKSSDHGTLEIRADACNSLPHLLQSILQLFPLDEYVESPVYFLIVTFISFKIYHYCKLEVFLMDRVDSDKKANLQVNVWAEFDDILTLTQNKTIKPAFVERFKFYEQAKKAYAVIQTGYLLDYNNKNSLISI